MSRNNKYRRRGGSAQKKRGRIYMSKTAPTRTGRFSSTSSGGVFFEFDPQGELTDKKYFIDIDDTMGAINGDTVTVKLFPGRNNAKVIKINERTITHFIGTYVTDGMYSDDSYVDPDDSKLRFTAAISGIECERKPEDGDKVEVRITCYPKRFGDEVEGVITEVFGNSCTRQANYSAILHQCGIITEFTAEAQKQAGEQEHDIPSLVGREDLRSELIFTIDGEDAKDLDDAISVKKTDIGYTLGVHIADVSHYVRDGSALDKDAFSRGTSIYFADKVVPMLPVALSNGICSLNFGLDRYALSAIIDIDRFGQIKHTRLCKSVINSKVRGVYSEINSIIDGSASEQLMEKYACVTQSGMLDDALELYFALKKKSEQRGALELDSSDCKVILDENGDPRDILRCERGIAERMIEQFMLCANEAVAMFLSENGVPCVYRVHDKPEPEKVMSFIKFAHNLGIEPPYCRKDNITPAYFGTVLDKARRKGLGFSVSYILLRTMQKAKYSENNSGHFGLSSKCYCHFTSPIRRYPDLTVHRIISEILENGTDSAIRKYTGFAAKAAKSSSQAELRALEAERAIDDLYKTIYMAGRVGAEYDATVSSVLSFGLFCMLDNTCEGLVSVSSMKNNYWYDPDSLTLSCAAKTYRIGDRVKIKVEQVDIATRRVDFSLLDEPQVSARVYGHSKKRV